MHDVGDAQLGDQLLGRPVGFELGDELQFEVAFDAQPRDGVQQVADALERHVGTGDRDDAVAHPSLGGLEQFGVHAERHDVQLIGRHREVLGDVGGRCRRDGEQLGDLARDLLLHLREAVPAAHQRLAPPLRGRHIQDAVPGDRVVHRGDHRHAQLGDLQQAGAEALVVVHDVEVVEALGQQPGGAQAERLGLGEAGRPGRQQLAQVDAGLDLAGPRDAERVRLAVEIEAGHLGQAHPRVEPLGVGLAGEHLDVVAEFDEPAGQVADVDPLPSAMGLAPVGQQRDAHGQLTPLRSSRTRPGPVSWTNRVTQILRTLWTCVQTIV